jgi:hypothetical protein
MMMLISRIRRNWNPFFFTPLDARPVALFRILSGCLMCWFMAAALPNWHRFFAADGMISLVSPSLENTRVNSSFGMFYWTEGIIPITAWWFVGMGLSLMFLLGCKTRWATVGLYFFIEAMLKRNPYIANGEELVLRMCLLYLALVNCGAVWSLDAMKAARQGRPACPVVPGWPVRMMQINIAMIYVISLPYKFAQDPAWVTGDAMHWTVASDMWGPFEHPWLTLAFGGLLRKLMTFGTVLVEAIFPLAVWFRPTRRTAIIAIAGLHLGIALTIPNVTHFTLSMVCAFAAFLTSEDMNTLQRIVGHCRALVFKTLPLSISDAGSQAS